LQLANSPEQNISTVAFPAISCGVFGYPVAAAAEIALSTCQAEAGKLRDIAFVLFSQGTFHSFDEAARQRLALLPSDDPA
jgi:O-acetyl-ADP-ribose deacetylase